MTQACYSEDGMGEQWLQWVASLDASWASPLREQLEAMFPILVGQHDLITRFRTCCFQLEEPEWEVWNWYPFWPAYQCDAQPWRHIRELTSPGRERPYLCRHDCELVANWMTTRP
jgi:hypothetical protein